jgi:hypothetical protein
MLRSVGKKVGQTYINPVGLQVFFRPARAMRNNPPQRGGLRHVNKFALKGQWIKIASPFALPFQGDCSEGTYPPRCGGLIRVAPKGAEEKLIFVV